MTPITTISDLHALPNWVVFAQEPQSAGGKPKKIPYTPATNHRAKVNDPRTWCGGWWRPRMVLRRRSASCPVIHQGFSTAWQTHLQATPACSGARSHRHSTLLGSLRSHPAFPAWHLIVVRFAAEAARSKRERQTCPRVSAAQARFSLAQGCEVSGRWQKTSPPAWMLPCDPLRQSSRGMHEEKLLLLSPTATTGGTTCRHASPGPTGEAAAACVALSVKLAATSGAA
jgi:hypothetical protein